jgi:TP901 family phage tail tape measure protein
MAERRVRVVFSAEIAGFRRAMDEAAAATRRTGDAAAQASAAADTHLGRMVQSATQNSDAWETAGATMLGFGASAVAGVGLAVKTYADFDKQMSSVKAATHETAANMDLLKQAAIEAGADTSFSAKEAAQGIEEMAKAGVSTKDILAGGLNGALALAAAGAIDVGEAAETAASAMTQFKLKGSDIPHIADLLAAGAGKAQGSVHDMGAALNQVGLVAAQTGLTIEETTGGLAAFASAGLTGSDAGTSFKTMLGALTPNSAAAASAMKELGISAFDSQGKFVGLSEFAGNLKESLSGLTDEQRNSTLETIFGSDAVRAAAVLYEQGADGVQKWEDAVNDAGYAAETAALMQDNLAGDLEKLGGSFDTVLLQSGSGANEVLRGLVQSLEDVVDAAGKVPAPVLSAGAGIAGVVGIAALGAGAFLSLTPKVLDAVNAFNTLAPAGGRARGALAAVGKAAGGALAIGAVVTILAKLAEADYMSKIDTGMGKVANALADVTTNSPGASAALDGLFKDRDGGDLINTVTDLESAIKRTFNRDGGQQFNDWGEAVVNGMTGVKGSSQILADQFDRLDQGLAGLVSGGKTDDAAKAFDKIKASADAQGVSVDDLKAKFPEYNDALAAAEAAAKTAGEGGDKAAAGIKAAGGAAADAAPSAEDLAKQLEDVGLRADGSVANLDKFTQALVNAGLLTLSSRDATANFDEALDGLDVKIRDIMATEQAHGGVLNQGKTDLDLYSEAGRAANDVLADMTQKGIGAAEAMAANGESMPAVQGQLTKTYDAMVKTAEGFGLGKAEAEKLTGSILHIPPGVDVKSWMSSEAKRMAEQTKAAIDNVPKNVTVNTTYNNYINEVHRRSQLPDLNGDASGSGRPGLATGGRVRGYADGGKLPSVGPGTEVTDGFLGIDSLGRPLARVDAGEWIINPMSSDRYNRELAAINAGTFPKLPGYANGGREYTAQSLGHGSYRATAAANVTYQIDAKPGLAYEYAKDIARQTATRTRDINAAYGI